MPPIRVLLVNLFVSGLAGAAGAQTVAPAFSPIRVPTTVTSVLVDTRCDDAEWRDAIRVPVAEASVLLAQQDAERVYLCVPLPAQSYGTMDLYVWPDGAPQPVNLHASAQVGERTRTDAGWPAWVFGNERGWYSPPVALAEATVDNGRARLRFQPVSAREIAIDKQKFGPGPWRVLLELRALGADKQGVLRVPANGQAESRDTWAALDLTSAGRAYATAVVETVALDAADLAERRDVWIDGPAVCRAERACDVLVVLDAHALFPIATAYARVMATMGTMTPLVIVGVPSTSPADRLQNFTTAPPAGERKRYPTAGGADAFLRFLTRDVVPAAGARFRLSGRHVLAGHSLAGLFAVHALATQSSFESYVALSPTLGWNDQHTLDAMRPVLASRTGAARRLFVSVAQDTPPYLDAYARFERDAAAAAPPWLTTRFERFERDDHVSTLAPALQRAMQWLFAVPGR